VYGLPLTNKLIAKIPSAGYDYYRKMSLILEPEVYNASSAAPDMNQQSANYPCHMSKGVTALPYRL
jgi:hypothetical protein